MKRKWRIHKLILFEDTRELHDYVQETGEEALKRVVIASAPAKTPEGLRGLTIRRADSGTSVRFWR